MRKASLFTLLCCLALVLVGASTLLAASAPKGPAAAIAEPASASIVTGDQAAVSVLFDAGAKAKVTHAELYVDGELHDTIAVTPPVSSGSCSLTWRCGQFARGDHQLTARVYDSLGQSRAVEVAVTLQDAAPARGAAQRIKITIFAPKEGQDVTGETQIRVAADETRVRYVMLLIDNVFVALTNMPPYTYAIDMGRYLNGPHTLKATAFDLADNAYDSEVVTVNVNNPGGRTEMRAAPAEVKPSQIIAAAKASIPSPVMQTPATGPAVTAATVYAPRISAAPPVAVARAGAPTPTATAMPAAVRTAMKPAAAPQKPVTPVAKTLSSPAPQVVAMAVTGAQLASPVTARTASAISIVPKGAGAAPLATRPPTALPRAETVAMAVTTREIAAPTTARTAPVVSMAPTDRSTASAVPTAAVHSSQQVALAPRIAAPTTAAVAPTVTANPLDRSRAQVAKALSTPTAVSVVTTTHDRVIVHTVRPGEQLATISARYSVPVSVIARFNALLPSDTVAAGRNLRIPWTSVLVLNGEQVYTDVPLTTENGIRLAPFRAIVEHSGGALAWVPESRLVRAKAFDHNISLTIGSRIALVDSAQHEMEAASTLLQGRAMVPLGLFRDALGFTVTLDADTGRIYMAAK